MTTTPLEDPAVVRRLSERIATVAEALPRPVRLMEVCGTHTRAIAAAGLRRLLPEQVRLVSGPGCPVCVTPVGYLDRAEALASLPGTTVATFGDLLRVPSSLGSLEQARARGGRVAVLYSPRDALTLARERPEERVVLLAVGFETTAPTLAATLQEAVDTGVSNLWMLAGNKVMPPALRALVQAPDLAVDGFLLPGHVSVITGASAFAFLATEHGVPSVVTGFLPTDVLRGVLELVEQRVAEKAELANHYRRVVSDDGNQTAQALLSRLFEPVDASWRGLGELPGSGLALRAAYADRDAARLEVTLPEPREPQGCRCGDVLTGRCDPADCPLFGARCVPETPVGACMVSSEGACAAWFRAGLGARGGRP